MIESRRKLLHLRLLVGYLGEDSEHRWWRTAFFEKASESFLGPVFSKTMYSARYHGVVEAARLVHDANLSVGSYHLFRLPEEVEQDLNGLLQDSELIGYIMNSVTTTDAAKAFLAEMANGARTGSVGPVAIGQIANLQSDDILRSFASVYLEAFSGNIRAYPYLLG
jgi:hypothetical protein